MRPDSVVNELVRPIPIYSLKLNLQRFGCSGFHCQGLFYKPVTRQHVGKYAQSNVVFPLKWDGSGITYLVAINFC